jgi:hypothetical protein
VTGAVMLHANAARDSGVPVVAMPVGAVLVNGTGETFVVRSDGGLDRVVQGGLPHSGIASDAAARRAR